MVTIIVAGGGSCIPAKRDCSWTTPKAKQYNKGASSAIRLGGWEGWRTLLLGHLRHSGNIFASASDRDPIPYGDKPVIPEWRLNKRNWQCYYLTAALLFCFLANVQLDPAGWMPKFFVNRLNTKLVMIIENLRKLAQEMWRIWCMAAPGWNPHRSICGEYCWVITW